MTHASTHTRSNRRRLQYSLLTLFVVTTLACLGLSWLVWPKTINVMAQVMASTLTISATGNTVPEPKFEDYQAQLLAAFKDREILADAVSIAGNGRLAMFRYTSDPVTWVRQRLTVTVEPNSIICVKLMVPEQFEKDAIELVDYITFRAVTQTARDIDPRSHTRIDELIERQETLKRTIDDTNKRLSELKIQPEDLSPEIALIHAELRAQQKAYDELNAKIEAARIADEFVDQLRFVQTATVIDKS
jgi:hypothetical protein